MARHAKVLVIVAFITHVDAAVYYGIYMVRHTKVLVMVVFITHIDAASYYGIYIYMIRPSQVLVMVVLSDTSVQLHIMEYISIW